MQFEEELSNEYYSLQSTVDAGTEHKVITCDVCTVVRTL